MDKDHNELWSQASDLARFEFVYLDNDGKTAQLEEWVGKGANIFSTLNEEIRKKYQYLVPPNFVEDSVATLELLDLFPFNGGMGRLEGLLVEAPMLLQRWRRKCETNTNI